MKQLSLSLFKFSFLLVLGASLGLATESSLSKPKETSAYADKSAFYMGGGYQLGAVSKSQTDLDLSQRFSLLGGFLGSSYATLPPSNQAPNIPLLPPIVSPNPIISSTFLNYQKGEPKSSTAVSNGFGLTLGYKIVGKNKNTKWAGVRFGIFYDFSASTYKRGAYFSNLTMQKTNSMILSTYGAYVDWLINAYNSEKFFAGFRLGIAFAGVSYSLKNSKIYQTYLNEYLGGNIATSAFQFLVNLGVRLGGKHNHFEFGIKIPTIESNYMQANTDKVKSSTITTQYKTQNGAIASFNAQNKGLNALYYDKGYSNIPYHIAFKRDFALYFNYIYSF
ncbi:outer membrane protein [Helicobacter cetorum]|uniref:outer membrane protein n=1 Tax=Helicobacter cetorum TaxID=138563 RepID=UPI000CF04E81|nr:outer membrane protein [Helicobacter cetorum]